MGIAGKNVSLTGRRDVRELDHRTNNGTDVTLLWHPPTNRVLVAVTDGPSNRSVEFEVDPADASAAFHHPYVYANDDDSTHVLAA